jgi:uncharacterized damage-inducible protein DinB
MHNTISQAFLQELEMEAKASRRCLENIPLDKLGWAPHEKSMKLGGLVIMTADMPRWIAFMIKDRVIDFGTYPQFQPKDNADLLDHFDKAMDEAREALKGLSDEDLQKEFKLQNNGHVLWATPLGESIGSTINHWVHHRGQLTVYMRLLNLPVPSLYGPSADEKSF